MSTAGRKRSQGAKEPTARRWETGSQRQGVELRRRKKPTPPPHYISPPTTPTACFLHSSFFHPSKPPRSPIEMKDDVEASLDDVNEYSLSYIALRSVER
jgi:hypothetical protein